MDPETTQDNSSVPTPVPQKQNPFIIPGAILIGFALIAVAIYFSGGIGAQKQVAEPDVTAEPVEGVAESIRPVDGDDHILGNPNAPIVIVEYSDFDCPFCKSFHETMNKVMVDYGATGQVAWVYRQFPLEQLHPNAPGLALASECVAELGGNDAFWAFSDRIFGERGVNEQTNMTQIPAYAADAGVDKAAFETCLTEGTYIDLVNEDFQDGVSAGVRGTPHSLVLVGGQQGVINGAQPYESVKQIIETLLTQIEGGTE